MGLEKIFGDGRKSSFKSSYKTIKKYLNPYTKDIRCELDIAAALLVIFDFAVYNKGQNREKVAQLICPIAKTLTNSTDSELQRRMDFYGEFIRGKQPRCDFCFGNGNVDNGLLRVIMALGDIVYNPNLIDDYDNAPVLIGDMFLNLKFTEIMKNKVTKEIASVFDYIIKYTTW